MLPLRLVLATMLAVLVLAPSAVAAINVEFSPQTTDHDAGIALREDLPTGADEVTITQIGLSYEIKRTGGGLIPAPTAPCTGDANAITCPIVPSVAIDLGQGDDKLFTSGVAGPLLIAGGDGN